MRETARLVATLAGARVAGSLPPSIDAIAGDSRAVRPGSLFIALRGERADGHDYIEEAITRGATAIVVESDVTPGRVPVITVPDTRIAASALAITASGESPCAGNSAMPMLSVILPPPNSVLANWSRMRSLT